MPNTNPPYTNSPDTYPTDGAFSGPEISLSPSYSDDRGTLVTTEFADVPFAVSRVFTVRGPNGGSVRGNHAVNGAQLLVLLSGTVSIENGTDADHLDDAVQLSQLGSRILLADRSYIRYTLPDENASILVLCERPFVARD